jgi:hypothetical protein
VPQLGEAPKCYAVDPNICVELAVVHSSGRYNSEVTSRTNHQAYGSLYVCVCVCARIHRVTTLCHKESVLGRVRKITESD